MSPIVGIALAFAGNLLNSVGVNFQRYAHVMNLKRTEPKPFTSLPLWWLGALLCALGETGNYVAYNLAPIGLIAPIGAANVISNAIISAYWMEEHLRRRDMLGSLLAALGGLTMVLSWPKSSSAASNIHASSVLTSSPSPSPSSGGSSGSWTSIPTLEERSIFTLCSLLILIWTLYFISRKKIPQTLPAGATPKTVTAPAVNGDLTLPGSGMYGRERSSSSTLTSSSSSSSIALRDQYALFLVGCTALCATSTLLLLKLILHPQTQFWMRLLSFLLVFISLTGQIRFLNMSFARFGTSEIVPVYFAAYTACVLVGDAIVFLSIAVLDFLSGCVVLLGLFLLFFGVYLLSSDRKPRDIIKSL
jgi:magnesium transporter